MKGKVVKKLINLIIIEDHKLVRQGLIKSIEGIRGLRVIAEGGNGLEAIELLSKYKADIILLDINMPLLDGLETLKKIKELGIKVKIIIVTAYPSKTNIMKAMKFGANGFITKNIDFAYLIRVIEKVYNNENHLEPSLVKFLHQDKDDIETEKNNVWSMIETLSPREYEILELISLGYSNIKIGEMLFISEKTVKNHITNIYYKIKVKSRSEAVIFCYENKIREVGTN